MLLLVLISAVLISLANCQQPYHEQYRPQLHFTPPKGWNNDPNGLLFYKDTYHLFYQYNPKEPKNGPQHWGHAQSKDLFHWENLPIALYPTMQGQELIWSGSATIDTKNASGLQPQGSPNLTMLAIFTGFHAPDGVQSQWLAYSNDDGMKWEYYPHNPIIPDPAGVRDFRDPKVFEYKDYHIIVLAAGDHLNFYKSQNFKDWELIQEFGKTAGSHNAVWECPDMFPINATVDGKVVEKWVITVNTNGLTQYFVGQFDGQKFTNDNPDKTVLWLQYGPEDYAGVTYNTELATVPNGRRVYIGWMCNGGYINDVPTGVWRGGMTLPRELQLIQAPTPDTHLRLSSLPVHEIKTLAINTNTVKDIVLTGNTSLDVVIPHKSKLLDIDFEVDLSGGQVASDIFGLEFMSKDNKESLKVYFNGLDNKFVIDRSLAGRHDFSKNFMLKPDAPRLTTGPVVTMRVVLDVSVIELFTDKGLTVMTASFYTDADLTLNIRLFYTSNQSTAQLKVNHFNVNELKSIWN